MVDELWTEGVRALSHYYVGGATLHETLERNRQRGS
jgi:hypothetical protein